jgi:hypothetical protein
MFDADSDGHDHVPHVREMAKDSDIWLVSYKKTKMVYKHHGPLYGQVIYNGVVQHLEMARRCHDVLGHTPDGSQTDAIFFDPLLVPVKVSEIQSSDKREQVKKMGSYLVYRQYCWHYYISKTGRVTSVIHIDDTR